MDDIGYRFRAINDWCNKSRGIYSAGWPNFHQAEYLNPNRTVYGHFLLKQNVVDWRDVPASEYEATDMRSRFTGAHDYARKHGYQHGFPNFHQANYGNGVVYGTFLIKNGTCEWRDVPAKELGLGTGDPSKMPMNRWFTGASDYAAKHGYVAAMPNGHYANYGNGWVCGVFLFPHGKAEWKDIRGRELGLADYIPPPPPPKPEGYRLEGYRFQQAHNYGQHTGFRSGFNNFHEANYGNGVVYGTFLVSSQVTNYVDILDSELNGNPLDMLKNDLPGLFAAVDLWAKERGWRGAYPTCLTLPEPGPGFKKRFSAIVFHSYATEARWVSASELGYPVLGDIGMMFRAVNDYSKKQPGFVTGLPTFRQNDDLHLVTLIKPEAVEWRDISAEILKKYTMETAPGIKGQALLPWGSFRFRQVNTWALENGYLAAFPSFQDKVGTLLLNESAAERHEVPASHLGSPLLPFNLPNMMYAVNKYARDQGYPAGFPSFLTGHSGSEPTYEIILLKPSTVEIRQVPDFILGGPLKEDVRTLFNEAHDYAVRHNFLAGYPTYQESSYLQSENYRYLHEDIYIPPENSVVLSQDYYLALLKPGVAEWRDIKGIELNTALMPLQPYADIYFKNAPSEKRILKKPGDTVTIEWASERGLFASINDTRVEASGIIDDKPKNSKAYVLRVTGECGTTEDYVHVTLSWRNIK